MQQPALGRRHCDQATHSAYSQENRSFTPRPGSDPPISAGEIPDAAFIHAARKKRQMARELGDFPPHDSEPGKGRLVREDENDASDDEDDDEKRRIVFSVKEKSQRQKIAEEIGNLV